MVLLLTDETWRRLTEALTKTDEGWRLLAEFEGGHELPSDRELIAMARKGEVPAEIARVRAKREAGIDAATQTRDDFNRLIRHVHGAGVPVATMARWFGVDRRSIYNVLGSGLTESAAS